MSTLVAILLLFVASVYTDEVHITDEEREEVSPVLVDNGDTETLNLMRELSGLTSHHVNRANSAITQKECDFLKTSAVKVANAVTKLHNALENMGITESSANNNLYTAIADLRKRLANLEKQANPAAPPKKRAFTVNLKKHLYKLGAAQTIMFDNIVYNPDGAYDTKSGIYQCPVDGVYMFHVSIMAHSSASNRVGVEIMKSGVSVAILYEYGVHGTAADQVIIPCNKNEKVWIRNRAGDPDVNLYGDRYTSFSGALLY